MVTTEDRLSLREIILNFQKDILSDPLLNSIYSVRPPGWYLHARGDHADINLKMTDFLRKMDYHLFLSQRQNNTVQRFMTAFERAVKAKNLECEGIEISCSIVRSSDSPEMSVMDYLLWALQRYILKGERRYFTALEKHYDKILDVYDDEGAGRLYDEGNRFYLEKASGFVIK